MKQNITGSALRSLALQVWMSYYDNPHTITMGDVALELGCTRASVRNAVQSLVEVDLLRANPLRAGWYEHDHYDDPHTAFEEMFPMKTDKTPTVTGDRGNADSATTECRCGCGEHVLSGKSLYRPGHDARHAGNVGRTLAALPDTATTNERHEVLARLGSDALRDKALRVEDKVRTQGRQKAERAAKREQAKTHTPDGTPRKRRTPEEKIAAKMAARRNLPGASLREPVYTEGVVKVGRWTYPARAYATGVLRNSKRDGSGLWIDHDGEMD